MKKTICELFAGVGGFRLGFERLESGWETVWFSQWEPKKTKQWAYDCYVKHFGDCVDMNGEYHTNEDIAAVVKENIPDFNLLTAGFPCQDYSVAGTTANSKGLEGKKGVLWWQIYETLKVKQPAFCLFENVDRLLISPKKQRGRDFGVMLSCLSSLGYNAEWRVVDSSKWGSNQRRKRVYIFAYHKRTNYNQICNKVELGDLLISQGFMQRTFPIITYKDIKSFEISEDIASVSAEFNYSFGEAGVMRNGTVCTGACEDELIVMKPLREVMEHDVDEKYFIPPEKMERWAYLKGKKRFNRCSKDGKEYVYTEGAIAFPDNIDKHARTILTSEGTLMRTSHVVADLDNGRLRTLTPVEVERLQDFDDNWTDTGMPERMRYFCMGNALVVYMVHRMGEVLDEIIGFEK